MNSPRANWADGFGAHERLRTLFQQDVLLEEFVATRMLALGKNLYQTRRNGFLGFAAITPSCTSTVVNSMMGYDFHLEGISLLAEETDPPLGSHANTGFSFPVSRRCPESMPQGQPPIVQGPGVVPSHEFGLGAVLDVERRTYIRGTVPTYGLESFRACSGTVSAASATGGTLTTYVGTSTSSGTAQHPQPGTVSRVGVIS